MSAERDALAEMLARTNRPHLRESLIPVEAESWLWTADAILASDWLAERDRRIKAEALREAADEVEAIERYGQSTSDDLTAGELDQWMSSPLNHLWGAGGIRPRVVVEQWLRTRADRIEADDV